ncbi:MAG TPA: hypothetical protein VFB62_21845 [Polyangiaceae bacterium]|jgi:tetratricopeptide (TPR) repeat protein|nr:hypothetical protein [Polyangiaceae bacterium]
MRVALLCALVLVASRAHGFDCPAPSHDPERDEEVARKMFNDALALEPSDPNAALERLRCAERHADKPAVALRIGTISERLGLYADAVAAFESYLELAGDSAPDRDRLKARIASLRKKMREREAEEGGDQRLFVTGWIVSGVGIGVGVAGGVLLAIANEQSDEVRGIEPGTVAWDSEEARGTFEAAERNQALGIAGLVVGGALIVGGVLLSVFTRPQVQAAMTTGPGARVTVTF